MSVITFRKSELENIAGSLDKHLRESGFQTWGDYERRDAFRAIAVASIANQTAAFLTYSMSMNKRWDDMRDLDDSTPGTLDAKETCKQIDSLLYNCVSNEGTDCLPATYRGTLETMTRSIVEKAAGWR